MLNFNMLKIEPVCKPKTISAIKGLGHENLTPELSCCQIYFSELGVI